MLKKYEYSYVHKSVDKNNYAEAMNFGIIYAEELMEAKNKAWDLIPDDYVLCNVRKCPVVTAVLCAVRHEMPENDGAIFDTTIYQLDVCGLERIAKRYVNEIEELTLYVNGLSVALVAVINACRGFNVDLTLMHYDRESGNYYPQKVR